VKSRLSNFRTGALLLAACALTACLGGRSPSAQFYNLSATETTSGVSVADKGPAISVGPVVFPKSLRRHQVVIRTGPNSVELDEFHRWAGSLESDFLNVLGANLGALLDTQRVAVYPAEAEFPVDYRVNLQVDRFDGTPGGTLVLNVYWTIRGDGAAGAAAVGHSVIDEPVADDSVEALIRAHDAAIGKLSNEIADRIKSL
jgi:uncharacterized lipoprotein YmbA